jgi:hypothetical protein
MLPDWVNFDWRIIKFDWLQKLNVAALLCIHLQSDVLHSFFCKLTPLDPQSLISLEITFFLVNQFLELSYIILQTFFFFTANHIGFIEHIMIAKLLIGWSSRIVGIWSDWSLKFAFLRNVLVINFLAGLVWGSYKGIGALKIFYLAQWNISWVQKWSRAKIDIFFVKVLYFTIFIEINLKIKVFFGRF